MFHLYSKGRRIKLYDFSFAMRLQFRFISSDNNSHFLGRAASVLLIVAFVEKYIFLHLRGSPGRTEMFKCREKEREIINDVDGLNKLREPVTGIAVFTKSREYFTGKMF